MGLWVVGLIFGELYDIAGFWGSTVNRGDIIVRVSGYGVIIWVAIIVGGLGGSRINCRVAIIEGYNDLVELLSRVNVSGMMSHHKGWISVIGIIDNEGPLRFHWVYVS